jgi:hypothetical protein
MKPTFSYGFLMAFLCDSVSGGAGFSHFSAPRTSSSVSFITRPKPGIGLARHPHRSRKNEHATSATSATSATCEWIRITSPYHWISKFDWAVPAIFCRPFENQTLIIPTSTSDFKPMNHIIWMVLSYDGATPKVPWTSGPFSHWNPWFWGPTF